MNGFRCISINFQLEFVDVDDDDNDDGFLRRWNGTQIIE